jgi:hypothetical protein
MLDGIPKRIEPIYVVKARKYKRRFLKKPFSAMMRDWDIRHRFLDIQIDAGGRMT